MLPSGNCRSVFKGYYNSGTNWAPFSRNRVSELEEFKRSLYWEPAVRFPDTRKLGDLIPGVGNPVIYICLCNKKTTKSYKTTKLKLHIGISGSRAFHVLVTGGSASSHSPYGEGPGVLNPISLYTLPVVMETYSDIAHTLVKTPRGRS